MREAEMKDKVEKYEFIYDVPPEEKLQNNNNNKYFNIVGGKEVRHNLPRVINYLEWERHQ